MLSPRYTGCIYLATNRINGRAYIGKSIKGLEFRRAEHIKNAKARRAPGWFTAALRKHGTEVFEWRILFESDNNELLCTAECEMIADYRRDGRLLYNLTDGGEGTSGLVRTEEHSRKISEALKGRPQSPEQRAAHSAKMKGRKAKQEHVAARAAALRGKKHSPEHIAKTRAVHLGRKRSDETRARISAVQRGRPRSEATKAKLRSANLGKKMSEDAISRTRAAHLGAKRSPESRERISQAQIERHRRRREALQPTLPFASSERDSG